MTADYPYKIAKTTYYSDSGAYPSNRYFMAVFADNDGEIHLNTDTDYKRVEENAKYNLSYFGGEVIIFAVYWDKQNKLFIEPIIKYRYEKAES